ncbi:MAG: LamG domain-containing protein [Pirellulaceae bacterium]|nr:LamG domain-containing protein [Pirellulaceae bacterium]
MRSTIRLRHLIPTCATWLIYFSTATGDILLPDGEPNPGYNRNAMQVWLRADSGVIAKQGAVSQWQDRSTHGHHASQQTTSHQPTHARRALQGRDVIQFGGGGDHLEFATGFEDTFTGDFTILALIAPNDGDPERDDVWFGLVGDAAENRVVLTTDGKENQFSALYKAGGKSKNTLVRPNPFANGPPLGLTVVTWVVRAGGTHQVFINGNAQPAAESNGDVDHRDFSSGNIMACLGAARDGDSGLFPSTDCSFAGRIAEFMIYQGALARQDRQAVEGYFLVTKNKSSTDQPISISTTVQLFVDDYLIASAEGFHRTVHSWKKHPQNPVLRPDKPWEFGGNYINTHGSVIYDEQDRLFKAWYWTLNDEDSVLPTSQIKSMCYATSSDGIHWEKPNVGLFEFQGSKDNNMVMASSRDVINSLPTLFTYGAIKTPSDPDPSRLYKACFYERPPGASYIGPNDGVWTAVSPDGIHWTKRNVLAIPQLGDTVGFCYDSIHQRYLCFGKRYTDRGRARFQSESTDFVNWTTSRLILETDDEDDQPCDLYNNTGFVWGDMLLGWLQVFYHQEDPFKHRLVLELIYSRDGLNWQRMPGRPTVLDVGPDGSWDRTNQSPAIGTPILVDDEMYLYYAGDTRYHGPYKGVNLGESRGQIGLGLLRRDGFVSMDATPSGGVLTTKPLVVGTKFASDEPVHLYLNVKADFGHCRVELLDEAGDPIDGFGKDIADDLMSDNVQAVATWKGNSDISSLVDRPLRLRFHLKNARLYSFRLGQSGLDPGNDNDH